MNSPRRFVGLLVAVLLCPSGCSSSGGKHAEPVRGGPCQPPPTSTTDAGTGRYAATYLALATPLFAAVQNVESGYVYSNPSKAARAQAIAAIATFDTAARRVEWPGPEVRANIQAMVRGEITLTAYLKVKNQRDRQSVLKYRTELDRVASPAWEAGQRVRAALSLPLPIPC